MIVKQGYPPKILPFRMDGVERNEQGVLGYMGLAESLVAMLEATVDAKPDSEGLVELGGERLSYRQVWDRSARISGSSLRSGLGRPANSLRRAQSASNTASSSRPSCNARSSANRQSSGFMKAAPRRRS